MSKGKRYHNPLYYVWFLSVFGLVTPLIALQDEALTLVNWLSIAFGFGVLVGLVVIWLEHTEHKSKTLVSKRPALIVAFSVVLTAIVPDETKAYIIFGSGSFLLVTAIYMTIIRKITKLNITWDDIRIG